MASQAEERTAHVTASQTADIRPLMSSVWLCAGHPGVRGHVQEGLVFQASKCTVYPEDKEEYLQVFQQKLDLMSNNNKSKHLIFTVC